MPPPSERTLLDGLRICTRADVNAHARSYLADGRCVGWHAPADRSGTAIVIDAELATGPPPTALARRFGDHDFWERWTRAECAAKACRVPIPVWLREHGLGAGPDISVRTVRTTMAGTPVVVSAADVRSASRWPSR
ncbi:hypothetical protein MU582_08895 [Nocardioidaceae bacterium SCSIO 66511]|nr:hypothetical protein MU582_08895 [Nocardioidaceae bacterium SCSIO 66511]